MSKLNLSDLFVGDIVRLTNTARVRRIENGTITFEDVQAPQFDAIVDTSEDQGSLRVDMVKRVNRKPKVGERVDGQRIIDTPWRRGTVLRGVKHRNWHLVLTAEGDWFAPREEGNLRYSFEAFKGMPADFEVAYLP